VSSLKDMDEATRSMLRINKVTPQNIQMAVIVIVILPIMCVYPFLQKYFVKGVLVGTIKG
jgi:putative aldouronate transport system permease protein